MESFSNDAMGASQSETYYRATATGQRPRATLSGRHDADVCVIGAGYTGVSCALHLARKGLRVAVLEAEETGFGASGRNGGQVITGQRVDQIELERRYGTFRARALWDLALEARETVRALIAENAIACDLTSGHLTAAVRDSHARDLQDYAGFLAQRYGYSEAQYVPAEDIENHVACRNYKGGLYDTGSFHLHPLNFLLGLADAAEKAGATIFESSRVTALSQGDLPVAQTAHGQVCARYVVFACNGYLGSLEPRLSSYIMPISNYIAATEPLGEARAKALIPSGAAVADTKFVLDYYRLSGDGRLIFGGGETYGSSDASRAAGIVRPNVLRVFPQLADVRIEYAWGGRLAITMPRMPHVGRLAPNMYFAQGYSGQGVAIATLAGKLMAEAIGGQAARFDVFAGLNVPRLPGGTWFRKPLLALALTWYALRDRTG